MLKQPAVILHELAHAYHDQVLGFEHPGILEAYQAARKRGDYEKVLHVNGGETKHYALTDHKEYFAEATEAFLYRNDFYPFVAAELKAHDPQAHELLEVIWQTLPVKK
jgi:dipeptidyl-peptidase-4